MWTEAFVLFIFSAGMTLLYAGLDNFGAGLWRLLRRRGADEAGRELYGSVRAALFGLVLLAAGTLAVVAVIRHLNST